MIDAKRECVCHACRNKIYKKLSERHRKNIQTSTSFQAFSVSAIFIAYSQ